MLVVETIAKIRRDHLVRGVPIKKIARDLRVSKNTVRKVVRGDETSFSYERKIQPMPKLGPWVEELERQLKANEKKARKDRLSLLQIHEDLASLGYKGGYDAVRRYARAWRRRWRLLSPSQAFVPLIFARRYTKPRGSPLLTTGTTSAVTLRGVNFARRLGVNTESRLTIGGGPSRARVAASTSPRVAARAGIGKGDSTVDAG